jgi:hypothetical protein
MDTRNYTAIAMKKRYGKTTSVMKDRRTPRGGNTNEQQGWLSEWEDEQEEKDEQLARLRHEWAEMT